MCIPYRLVSLVLGVALTGCGGSLALPDDGSPAALRVVSGDGQEAPVGSRLDEPLVVRLTDGNSRPLAGVPIVFRFQSEVPEAEVDPTEAATDSEGLAAAQVRLGADAGTHIVEARVADAAASELRATFDLTAVEKGKKKGGHGGDDGEDD